MASHGLRSLAVICCWLAPLISSLVAADDSPVVPEKLQPLLKNVQTLVEAESDSLEAFYKDLHSNPELSMMEERTAGKLAREMRSLGFEVTTGVGKTGIVCVLKNGDGPTVLVRTDMDALPVIEKTKLPYASTVRTRDRSGNEVGVMHACGHDIHMSCWIGAARTLVKLKGKWSGTLVFIGQPGEEIGTGARLMLADGLYEKFPKPDYALALHADAKLPIGQIGYSEGLAMANVDTVEIVVRGKGGHGAAPHTTVDPIILAAKIVLDFQNIVGREVDPLEPVVITVGSIHGGTKSNIIPNDVKLQVTVRTASDPIRKQVLEAMERIVVGHAKTARAPEPTFLVDTNEFTPALYNETKLTQKTVSLFQGLLGSNALIKRNPSMGGEDFARYARGGVPIFMYFLGTIDQPRFNAANQPGGTPLPSMHADTYFPTPAPSIRLGSQTMTLAVLNLLPIR
ncbi:amidohydrolase [Tuwongella immobilis]|uniref:Peptidase M20 dimerisation domain-containing protein n=1 Tax=Tuwongella immobilis TaxID=692036 RepID=A0A6C2YS93_9BACT|nr:amidohydrolase [Tuwongella immobilis]VIP04336.1 peptidase m20 : Peptidase M20 OS=Cystobacter violaceus Cb vi76 GN=Q664_30605 PE=4 SV=1: Peptidase_M20: M20_dimer [Tuwongella immobilis]VTS06034.1 peptidase m20 : Peptidase M20 OS=Cystobacter violaceus Cb vi76 GN=Q664_30605 PE=4 SV=1: Peptidase_M20: M20_dimer [Tuwongella immobilis]